MKKEIELEIEEVTNLWKNFNNSSKLLKDRLGRTSNLVGEYAEYLANKYLNGVLLPPSSYSADIKSINGDLYQVKSRKISKGLTSQLSIIRSWDFDYLIIILFDIYGSVLKGCIYPKSVAIKYAFKSIHQNGWVITTTNEFLEEENKIDITQKLKPLILDKGKMTWSELIEKTDHDELIYKLTLKYLRRDGFNIGNSESPEIKPIN